MNAEIKKLYSVELEDVLELYEPAARDNFGTWIRLAIGPKGEQSADYFELFVCTPLWLADEIERDPPARWARHFLVVGEYSLELITDQCDRMVRRCSGDNWMTIARKIARFAHWEFEDMES